jgi:hypothetical protein
MARTHPFFRHIHHATGIMSRAPEPERYPYHDHSECPIGQRIKKSGNWQYYLGHVGEERERCTCCIELASAAEHQQTLAPAKKATVLSILIPYLTLKQLDSLYFKTAIKGNC